MKRPKPRAVHPLAKFLAQRGIEQSELAEAAGVDRVTIYRVMHGHNTYLDVAACISRATRGAVTLEELAAHVRK